MIARRCVNRTRDAYDPSQARFRFVRKWLFSKVSFVTCRTRREFEGGEGHGRARPPRYLARRESYAMDADKIRPCPCNFIDQRRSQHRQCERANLSARTGGGVARIDLPPRGRKSLFEQEGKRRVMTIRGEGGGGGEREREYLGESKFIIRVPARRAAARYNLEMNLESGTYAY